MGLRREMLSHKDLNKAQRYLQLLDQARCSGNWEEVSRLRLKIAKHAPHRKCLQSTVAMDCIQSTQPFDRPSTSSSLTPFDYGQRVPEILTALKYGNPTEEDTFHAEVCLSWLHWTTKEPSLALARLPVDLQQIPDRLTPDGETLTGWTHVCVVKGAFIRGACQENAGNLREAVQTYESMLPYISSAQASFGATAEHRRWTERLLARHCLLSSRYVKSKSKRPKDLLLFTSLIAPTSILAPFRAWAEFWDATSENRFETIESLGGKGDISRKLVWQAYYDTLSLLLQIESTYPSTSTTQSSSGKGPPSYETQFFSTPKSQQCIELKRIESIYEEFLLNELKFPKANDDTPEIESWVDQVIANWKVLCGNTWLDDDHVDGGKESTGRKVLATLYRAATRSFHSTRILRHLFTVHAALADFILAGKALDTYFQIVNKGKSRVEKSGERELGFDDDATAILTIAAGMKMLCRYGRRKEAERAMELAVVLERWLQRHYAAPLFTNKFNDSDVPNGSSEEPKKIKGPVHGQALAAGFCALGITQAHWASITPETSARPELQTKALSSFHIASEPSLGDEENIETLYYLALNLYKTRDVDSAIAVAKRALSNNAVESAAKDHGFENGAEPNNFLDTHKRRFLLKSWHLLAILLSAEHKFSTAATSCEAALELFGIQSVPGRLQTSGMASILELSDKESIIEIKITQIALAEIVDGPEEAVNSSGELLGLYTKLFNYSEGSAPKKTQTTTSPPATRNGTVRSLRESFLSRSKNINVKPSGTGPNQRRAESSSFESQEPPITVTRTPTISVTADGSGNTHATSHHSHNPFHHESKKLHKRNSKKSVSSDRRSRASSLNRLSTANSLSQTTYPVRLRQPHVEDEPLNTFESLLLDDGDFSNDGVGVAISHDLPSFSSASSAVQNFPPTSEPLRSNPPVGGRLSQSITNSNRIRTRLPHSHSHQFSPPSPSPVFPPALQTRHALTLLTKIWLLISSLYRRANMPTDAQGALAEATKHVSAIESAVAGVHSSAEALSTPDWGGLKSVAELWADVLTEKGKFCLAHGDKEVAEEAFENALNWYQDHPGAIVSLAGILLDFHSHPSTNPPIDPFPHPQLTLGSVPQSPSLSSSHSSPSSSSSPPEDPTLLPRLAARDRAYGLLSSLTKSGRGWDCAEAWFAFARACEDSGQVARAREALWWVVELEEARGVRGWECLA